MRIAITGDNHLDFLYSSDMLVHQMMQMVDDAGVDLFVNTGDITNGRLYRNYSGLVELLSRERTVFVTGNHDLWSPQSCGARKPNESFKFALKMLTNGTNAVPLELSFSDTKTVWTSKSLDTAVVGSMGFPDFSHPIHPMPKEYYDTRSFTNDNAYMDLSMGWLHYTKQIVRSFEKRLAIAVGLPYKDIVIATHYPIFESQYKLSRDDISAYFFCHTIGNMVKKVATEHPEKRFWCFASHAHDYCRGELISEGENIVAYGLVADYRKLTFAVIDTSFGFNQPTLQMWLPPRCKTIIESRVHNVDREV